MGKTAEVGGYVELLDAIAELGREGREGSKITVIRQMCLAEGYGWGWQDGKGAEKDSEQVWKFHLAFGWHALQYERAEIGYRLSVTSAWEKFVAGVEF